MPKEIKPIGEHSMQPVDRLFHRMGAIYGHRWHSLFPSQRMLKVAKREWQLAIAELSVEQLEAGFSKCKKMDEWNPSIPEFLRFACGLPDLLTLQSRILSRSVIDPVTWLVLKKIPYPADKTLEQLLRYCKIHYQDAYEQAYESVKGSTVKWEPPKPLPAITVTEKPADPVVAQEHLVKAKEFFQSPGVDPRHCRYCAGAGNDPHGSICDPCAGTGLAGHVSPLP